MQADRRCILKKPIRLCFIHCGLPHQVSENAAFSLDLYLEYIIFMLADERLGWISCLET
jgi:hypothetical protein